MKDYLGSLDKKGKAYHSLLDLVRVTGCRPNEALKALDKNNWEKAAELSLAGFKDRGGVPVLHLRGVIEGTQNRGTKTGEDYKWIFPKPFD